MQGAGWKCVVGASEAARGAAASRLITVSAGEATRGVQLLSAAPQNH